MILNCPAVFTNSTLKIKPAAVTKPYFTGSNILCEDEFIAKIYINSYISSSVNEDECRKIIKKIKSKPADGKGVNAEFFNLGNIGVKKQNDSMALGKEASALKYLNSLGVTNIPKNRILFMYKHDNYLVTDVLKGKNPAIENGVKLTQKNLSSLFNTFFQMDKALFLHYDLHKGNILIDKDKANIVDFGNYNYVGNYGSLITSDNYSGSTPDSIEKSPDERFIKRLYGVMYDISHFGQQEYEWNNVDNPNFPFLSNIVNFEFRFLSDYMKKYENLNPAEAKEFYVNYLKQKAEYSLMRVKEYSPMLENIHDTEERDFLQKGLEYEEAAANVLKKPDKNVIEIEKLKMDLKAMLFEKLFKDGGSNQSYKVIHETHKKLLTAINTAYINNPDDKDMQLYAKCQYKIYTNNYWRQF